MLANQSGIYAIRHLESGRVYIGSSILFSRRWSSHRNRLSCGTHHSKRLQNAWNKYGALAFVFEVLETVENKSDLLEREQFWIDNFQACSRAGYNVLPLAGRTLGYKMSEETKAKLRARATSEETRAKMRARPRNPLSAEGRAKVSAFQKGRPKSAETKQRMSQPKSEEHKIKQRKPKHPGFGAKISSVQLGRKHPPDRCANMSAARKGKPWTPVQREAWYKRVGTQQSELTA